MGLPQININFIARARMISKRADRGIVGMILKDAAELDVNPIVIKSEEDIPATLSADNQEQIKLAMVGNQNAPLRIVAHVLGTEAEDYSEALNYFVLHKVTYLCAPTCETDAQAAAIAEWVKTQRKNKNKVKAVLPNQDADSEGIINYTTESATVGGKAYTAEQFCSRIAGLLAGTAAATSCTYSILEDVTDCTSKTRAELDTAIDNGEFVIFYDGEDIKVGRGVNSLQTVGTDKSNAWKKIHVVETMDTIHDDLTKLMEDYYVGKFPNNYDNRCLLLSAVMNYFQELVNEGLLSRYSVDFDVAAIESYIKNEMGQDTSAMTEAELRQADTDSYVFLTADCGVLDAIEDVTINITV